MKINSKTLISIALFFILIELDAQVVNDSLLIDGHYRTFHFNLPSKNSVNASLIFVLHGSGGNGLKSMKGTAKLLEVANKENLIILFPDGYLKNWNECRKNAPAAANVPAAKRRESPGRIGAITSPVSPKIIIKSNRYDQLPKFLMTISRYLSI